MSTVANIMVCNEGRIGQFNENMWNSQLYVTALYFLHLINNYAS